MHESMFHVNKLLMIFTKKFQKHMMHKFFEQTLNLMSILSVYVFESFIYNLE